MIIANDGKSISIDQRFFSIFHKASQIEILSYLKN